MTVSETMGFVRMLLDDSRDSYVKTEHVIYFLNQAQISMIRQLYAAGEERGLRSLYRITGQLSDGDAVEDGDSQPLLYPRVCRLYEFAIQPDGFTSVAKYLDHNIYLNYTKPKFDQRSSYPRAAYYTLSSGQTGGVWKTYLHFSGDSSVRAKLWYVVVPKLFNYDAETPANNYALQLPSEYHPAVAASAAEQINNIDVNEFERGNVAFQNQKLNIQGVGAVRSGQ